MSSQYIERDRATIDPYNPTYYYLKNRYNKMGYYWNFFYNDNRQRFMADYIELVRWDETLIERMDKDRKASVAKETGSTTNTFNFQVESEKMFAAQSITKIFNDLGMPIPNFLAIFGDIIPGLTLDS